MQALTPFIAPVSGLWSRMRTILCALLLAPVLLSFSAHAAEEVPAASAASAAPDQAQAQTQAATTNTTKTAPPAPKPDKNGYYVGGPVYVSDKNKIWTRSGPSEGYRVTGSRQIGERMTFKRYSDNGRYAQLEGADGQSFWMPLDSLQPDICGEPLANELIKRIADLQYRLDNYDNELARELKTVKEQLEQLTRENTELKTSVTEKEASIQELDTLYREASESLETKDLDMQMRWWMQGAIIALCGAVAGVIFVFIPRPSRKQRRDRY